MGTCSFCNREGSLTDEHVWSECLYRVFPDIAADPAERGGRDLWTLGRLRKVRGKDADKWHPQIKDLCKPCNNSMQDADASACAFAARHLVSPIPRGTVLEFPGGLDRWSVKTACNHARSWDRDAGTRSTWWQPLIPYMRGEQDRPASVDVIFGSWPQPDAFTPEFDVIASSLWVGLWEARTVVTELSYLDSRLDFSSQLEAGWALKV